MLKRYKKRNVKKNQQSEKGDVTIVKKMCSIESHFKNWSSVNPANLKYFFVQSDQIMRYKD